MPTTPSGASGVRARATDHVAIAVGTVKGLFILSDGVVDGPWFKGLHVTAFLQVGETYIAATTDPFFGSTIQVSTDGGATWEERAERPLAFPAETGAALTQVWQLQLHRAQGKKPRILAGVEPAALFVSDDLAQSFRLVDGLWEHPHRSQWEPGGGGLGLHTILTHPERPDRIIVGISTGGVYVSDDNGSSWAPKNKGIHAVHLPEPAIEFGQCVHKATFDAEGPDVLWLQNHWGIYRSVDGAETWENVGHPGEESGVPSDFGFPIVAHPDEPGTAYVFPLEADGFRCSPEGICRVYRTADGGQSWEPLGRGLPTRDAYLTVLRDGFTVGEEAPYPLVFGTRTGQVYASVDSGEQWRLYADHLPPVLCARVLA